MNELPTYVLDRNFNAPPALVWKAWSDPVLFARWYGPNVETIVHHLDLRPGGTGLIEMRWGETSNFQRLDYLEVAPFERMAWLHANADADGNIVANESMPGWPRLLLTSVSFTPVGDATDLRLTWTPHEASDDEIACFAASMDRMGRGWAAGMAILEEVLAEMQQQ
jgi:uncharacterized protein YndB with AHSA1/START domain